MVDARGNFDAVLTNFLDYADSVRAEEPLPSADPGRADDERMLSADVEPGGLSAKALFQVSKAVAGPAAGGRSTGASSGGAEEDASKKRQRLARKPTLPGKENRNRSAAATPAAAKPATKPADA